ncbi:efflux RND transporter periplasmic adaptor subunit [Oceanobacter sp. 5_MG-2023]|uniref:efflux RND transporter periplasmic adaptor subunit n=1 Tax=Oceanobacter sp. 5_MG-2023 TaxID=3062645 RepID=UPI0026E442BA|nr:efflux RND transporter periplasmic adaptor subunit [Oceanobacter sp. 5_MG-2023]MDO6681225.1 efflux RND transporter periplasmic adaptor subunit [Oceanobacter sp. 5_MG-2023]
MKQPTGLHKQTGNVWLVLLVLVLGGAAAWIVLTTAPVPERVKPVVQARLVEVQRPGAGGRPTWTAGGQVSAAERILLQAQVSGRVVSVASEALPGATLKAGARLLTIEPRDYELALQRYEAARIQAQADLDLELGQSALAADEYQLAQRELTGADRALVLREPQLASARAKLLSARAETDQARLNLARTRVTMPFNGQILSRNVAVGSQVSSSVELFELVNTDEFWIEVKVPRNFLAWLDVDAPIRLYHPSWGKQSREARILNLLADVDERDRQARLMVAVSDPLSLKDPEQPVLMLNDFVSVELQGKAIPNSVTVPLQQLNDDGSLWVVNNNQMVRRTPEVLYRGRTRAWIGAGLQPDDQLLVNRLDSVTEGLPVRLANWADAGAAVEAADGTSSREPEVTP